MKVNSYLRNPIAAALLGASAVGVPLGALYAANDAPQQRAPAPASSVVTVNEAGLPDFSKLVESYGPAVVNISVKSMVKTGGMPGMPQLGPDHPFSRFFGPQAMPPREVPMMGQGSGFIVSKEGVILTNAHVVSGAKEVTVKLTDKREFTAKVLGTDERTDVAVLKIEAKDLPIVRLGNKSDVKVGEWVVAIGAPFGFENSVTQGIVSASSRSLPDGSYVPFIQTDVAINPGNSGGPLFNLRGEVIGINSQIYSRSGGYEGVSFAIPMNVAMNVAEQLQEKGRVERGKLGVTIQTVDQSLANSFGLDRARGALVSSVENGGAAAQAGIQAGDVIVKFEDQPIVDANDLPMAVASHTPGSKVELTVWRDGREREIDVKLDALNDQRTAANAESATQDSGKLGLAVRPLTDVERQQAETKGGLLVEDVTGPAQDAGIRPGDIVLSVNAKPVQNVDQMKNIVDDADKQVALLIQRGEARIFVPVRFG